MPYRKVSCTEQMWYILKFKWKEVTRMPRKPKHPCHYPGCEREDKGDRHKRTERCYEGNAPDGWSYVKI